MKRNPSLAILSREHHTALVWAKRAQRAALNAGERPAFISGLRALFAAEIEPHFQAEEQLLLPDMERAGAEEAAARIRREHAELRQLVAAMTVEDDIVIARFAALFDAHVRFEERELFAQAESLLSESLLASIARRLASRRGGS